MTFLLTILFVVSQWCEHPSPTTHVTSFLYALLFPYQNFEIENLFGKQILSFFDPIPRLPLSLEDWSFSYNFETFSNPHYTPFWMTSFMTDP